MLSRCQVCLRPLLRATASAARPSVAPRARPMRHFSRLAFATPSSIATSPRIAAAGRTRSISVLAQPPPNPSQDFEPIEPEDLLPGEQLSMSLTDSAVKQIERAQQAKQDPQLALRLLVESGGCHGYQYKMAVTSQRDQDDYLFAPENTTAKLLVDSASLPLVKGSTIDYATELIGSSFRVMNNPQSKDAGCGCGVSWELKDL